MIQLRLTLMEALTEFHKLGQPVSELAMEMKNKQIRRGENFEGRVN